MKINSTIKRHSKQLYYSNSFIDNYLSASLIQSHSIQQSIPTTNCGCTFKYSNQRYAYITHVKHDNSRKQVKRIKSFVSHKSKYIEKI